MVSEGADGLGVELVRRVSFFRLPRLPLRDPESRGSAKPSMPLWKMGSPLPTASSSKNAWLRSSSTARPKLLPTFFRMKLTSKSVLVGNISRSNVLFSPTERFSSSTSCCFLLASSSLCASLSISPFRLSDCKECEKSVGSVSSEGSSPCHNCAREEEPWLLESSGGPPLVPEGSKNVSLSAITLSLRPFRTVRSSSIDSEFERS